MKANEFVKKFGLVASRNTLKAPIHSTHIRSDFEYFSNRLPGAKGWFKFDDVSDCWIDENPYLKDVVKLKAIQRLVESHEMIKEHGSIDRAKMYAESIYTAPEVVERLKQAIADVESCIEVSSESN